MSKLIILKTHRNEKYSTINLNAIEDPRLSWKAKGIHTYLITRPPEWKVYTQDLLKKAKEGKFSLTKAINELRENGYLKINILKDEKGKFTGTAWEVFETPQSPHPGFPPPGFTEDGKTGNGKTDNNNNHNNNNQNNKTTTDNVVVSHEKNNFTTKNTNASTDIDTLIKTIKGTNLEESITEKVIRSALKAYNHASHANYQPETPLQGIRRILNWMKHIPTPDNPPGFLVRMAREGMDKPSVIKRNEQKIEAERLEQEQRERERARLKAIEEERKNMTNEERAEIKRLIASITKTI